MNLSEIIARDPFKRSEFDITRIYHGRENCCRCGCGGRYFDKGTRGFQMAINKLSKPYFKPLKKGDIMCASYGDMACMGVQYGENYIDIPYNADNDKCYTLYFD